MNNWIRITGVIVLASFLLSCQANPSSFSPDISTTIRPQASDAVNVNDEDIRVTVRNLGDINAYETTVDITVDGDKVRERTIDELPGASEEVIRFERGGTLTSYCGDDPTALEVSASPNVKDLDSGNNEASQLITC